MGLRRGVHGEKPTRALVQVRVLAGRKVAVKESEHVDEAAHKSWVAQGLQHERFRDKSMAGALLPHIHRDIEAVCSGDRGRTPTMRRHLHRRSAKTIDLKGEAEKDRQRRGCEPQLWRVRKT